LRRLRKLVCDAGHPRLNTKAAGKTWMAGTSSAKTRFALLPGHDEKANRFQVVRKSLKTLAAFSVILSG